MKSSRIINSFAALTALSAASFATTGNVIHVRANAPAGGDGSSWATAFDSLQDGLLAATEGDQLWLAEGKYSPDYGQLQTQGDRTASFWLRPGVELYGGFKGHETLLEDRAGSTRRTILTGDLNRDDNSVGNEDNSYHVVTALGVGSDSVLDGLSIVRGNANGIDTEDTGGGIFVRLFASPVLRNVSFRYNSAILDGAAGIILDSSTPSFEGCSFFSNNAAQDAGALYLAHSAAPSFDSCRFIKNNAGRYGGAINLSLAAEPTFSKCVFRKNTAVVYGGALYSDNCNAQFDNCHFNRNSSEGDGGAYYGTGNPVMNSCYFSRNTAGLDAGGMFIFSLGSAAELTDCVFVRNEATRHGGGLFSSGKLDLDGCRFARNQAGSGGGGVNISGTGQLATISMSRFNRNTASGLGGGLCVAGTGEVEIDATSFFMNSAQRGGGIYHGESALTMNGCRVRNNDASQKGGGVYLFNAIEGAELDRCIFRQNNSGIVGGGLYVTGSSSPVVTNSTFFGNNSEIHGGAVYNTTSEGSGGTNFARYEYCDFVGNTALMDGAAFFNSTSAFGGECRPMILGCNFYKNKADKHGGAIYNAAFGGTSSPQVYNSSFTGNKAWQNGGAVYNLTNHVADSIANPDFVNCIFNGNEAGILGGAFYNASSSANTGSSNPTLIGCTLAFNKADVNGGGFYNAQFGDGEAAPMIGNSILWYNSDSGLEDGTPQLHVAGGVATTDHCTIQNWLGTGSGMASDLPLFRDKLGKDGFPGTPDDDYRLLRTSPCVDTGSMALLPSDEHDLDGDLDTTEILPVDRFGCARYATRGTVEGLAPVDRGAIEEQKCRRNTKKRRLERLLSRLN